MRRGVCCSGSTLSVAITSCSACSRSSFDLGCGPMRPLLVAAVLAATATVAQAEDPKLEFEKYKLPNGLEVILSPDNRVPLVAVNVWYHVGSGNEAPGKSGFAHLFEHMM